MFGFIKKMAISAEMDCGFWAPKDDPYNPDIELTFADCSIWLEFCLIID